MPEAKGDSHSMKKTISKQPDAQVTPPAQPAEAVRQTGEGENPVAVNSAAALRERLLGTLARTKRVVSESKDRQAAKQRTEEERLRQEERARKMGEFGDLKTQKRDAEERLQPILKAHSEALATLEAAKAEMEDKKTLLRELQDQIKEIIPPDGITDDDATAAIVNLEENLKGLQSSIEHDEGTVVPAAQQQVDALYAEKVDAEKEVAQTAHSLKTPEFEGLETKYDEAFQQYQALEARVDDLAGKYAELDEKLKRFARDAKDKSKTAGGYQHCAELETAFEALDEEDKVLIGEVVEAQIIPDADQLDISHQLEAISGTCHGFKIGAVAFERAADLLGSVSRARASLETARMNLFNLQVEAFQRKNGVEAGGMYPENLFRIERIRKGKKDPELLGYGFAESNPNGKGEIIGDHLLVPGLELKDIRGRDIIFESVREEQEKRSREATSRRSRPDRRRTGEQGSQKGPRKFEKVEGEAPKTGIPGLLAKLRTSVKPGEVAPAKQLRDRIDAFLAENREEVALKKGAEDVSVSVPVKGVYRVFAMDGKTKVAIGVVRYIISHGRSFVVSKVRTLGGFETAVRDYLQKNGPTAKPDLFVDLYKQAVETETARLNPELRAEGGKADSAAAAETVEETAPAESGSLRAMYREFISPREIGQKATLAEKIAGNCDRRITGDIKMEKIAGAEGEKEARKYSCPGWFTIMKDSFALGVVKVEEKDGNRTVVAVVTDPEYQKSVEALVQGMIEKGKIQTTGAKIPLQEGLIPIGQNKLKDLFVEPGSLKAMYREFIAPKKQDQKTTINDRIAKICDERITGDIEEESETNKFSCPGWFTIMKDSFALGAVKVEEKDGNRTVVEVVTDPEYQKSVEALVQGMIKRGEIQTTGAKIPLQKGLVPIGQNRLKKLYKAVHKDEEKKA